MKMKPCKNGCGHMTFAHLKHGLCPTCWTAKAVPTVAGGKHGS